MMQAGLAQSRNTPIAEIDLRIEELAAAKTAQQATSLGDWRALIDRLIVTVREVADDWTEAACRAKQIPVGSPVRAEEILAGPAATLRHLRLLHDSLRDIDRVGRPRAAGPVRSLPNGQLSIRLVPDRRRQESIVYSGATCDAILQPNVTAESFSAQQPPAHLLGKANSPNICLVLGAGNVSSIAAADTLTKIFQDGRLVLLKMNPVNDYLGPLFERALAPLIKADLLRIVYGGAETGTHAIAHEMIDEVHVTGSSATHDAIVWGPPGPERERRRQDNTPLLDKPITSELGNVSPWIIVPGKYSARQLRFQAECVATSIVNNASFNCIATKVIVTARDWPDRERFLEMLRAVLNKIPPRVAYYPGAAERYQRFTGSPPPSDVPAGTLPWTLLCDVNPEKSPHFFREESFVCVCVETALSANSPEAFLTAAADFVNERIWGTLAATVTVPPKLRKSASSKQQFDQFLIDLRYGAVGVNHWPGITYAMMTPPWGGFPGATKTEPQSGIGWVHNTTMIDGIEKTITEGPITIFPKPTWFATHKNPEPISRRLLDYNAAPSLWNLQRLVSAAVVHGLR